MLVIPAPYGYASTVTSSPRSRAPAIISRQTGASARQLLLMWTMCTGAPLMALAAIISLTDSMLEPGSVLPTLRMCTNTGRCRSAASWNIRITSRRVAPGVYSSPIPMPKAPASSPFRRKSSSRASWASVGGSSVAGPEGGSSIEAAGPITLGTRVSPQATTRAASSLAVAP